jgi:hypothetical protein
LVCYREALRRFLFDGSSCSDLAQAIADVPVHQYPADRCETIRQLIVVAQNLLSEVDTSGPDNGSNGSAVLEKALRYIHANRTSGIAVRDVADHVRRRPKYLAGVTAGE